MRIFDAILVVIGLAGLGAMGWWGLTRMPTAAAAIEEQLKVAAQDELQRAGHGWAQVTMDGQVATVRGVQLDAERVGEAERAVLTSSGHGGLVYGGVTMVKSVIDVPPLISPFTWSARKTPDGMIELGGYVPSDAVRTALVSWAEAAGDVSVADGQTLGAGVPGAGWQGIAERAIDLLSRLDEGAVRLRDTRLTLHGFAADPAVRANVRDAMADLPEPFTGEADLRGPGRWSARHLQDQLVLSGTIESEAERTDLLALGQASFDGEVVDEMNVGTSAYPGWLDGVRLGLPHFARFFSGEMAFDPEGDGYRFEGAASGSVLRYLAEDLAGLESPHGVTLAARPAEVEVGELEGLDFTADPRAACETAFATVLETGSIVFETGSAEISRESGATLDKLMAVSRQCDERLVFELGGHTDNQGARAANIRLSKARAEAVAAYMVEAGFDADRLEAVGYGPDAPVADNETEDGRAANRRLEIKVLERSE